MTMLSLLDWKGAYLTESLAYCGNLERKKSAKLSVNVWNGFIDERSEPPSDKLGDEVFIASPRLYVCHITFGLTTNTMPTRNVCAHSHLFKALRRGNQITMQTENERERDCTQRFITDKYTLFISTRATVLQRYLRGISKLIFVLPR